MYIIQFSAQIETVCGQQPVRKKFMSRMYERWCEMHLEHSSHTLQNLQNYVPYLRWMEYVRVPLRLNSPVAERHVLQAERIRGSAAGRNAI